MTLLQNKNDILPLRKSIRKLAVIGPNADDEVMLWGNYNGTPVRTITILDGIRTKLKGDRILYDKGCDLVEDKNLESYFKNCSIDGKAGFKVSFWYNQQHSGNPVSVQQITNPIKSGSTGRQEFAPGVKPEGFSAQYETDFVAPETEEIVFRCGATGFFELTVNGLPLVELKAKQLKQSQIAYCYTY